MVTESSIFGCAAQLLRVVASLWWFASAGKTTTTRRPNEDRCAAMIAHRPPARHDARKTQNNFPTRLQDAFGKFDITVTQKKIPTAACLTIRRANAK
jgi:hypothetical protein